MKKKLLITFIMLVLVLAACSSKEEATNKVDKEDLDNLNESGMPIVDESIELHFMSGKAPTTAKDYNAVSVWKAYQDLSNIVIDWELVQTEELEEKRNLSLASGNLPDVFYTSSMPNKDLVKYGKQGVFLELNDLIEKYMPNLTKLLDDYPEIKEGITFPDGKIYSLPTIYDPDFSSLLIGAKPWINKKWLDQLDMDIPETTDEFYDYLKKVKETDLNNNGKADEIPYGGTSIGGLVQWLSGSYGVQNRGANHSYIDVDPDTNELRFFPISDNYKELLEYVNKLYNEGLIQENIFSVELNQSYATGAEGLYGSTVITSPETIYGKEGAPYVGISALEGPHGDRSYPGVRSPLIEMGGFVVTNENEHPAATLRWMDYFYSDKGTKLYFMGIENETYKENEDGSVDYVNEIKDSPEGLSFEQELAKHVTWLGGGYPGYVKEEFFKGAESLPSSIKAAEAIDPYLVEEIWPSFTYTIDESEKMAALKSDIEKYVDEMQDKFITGDASFDEWDKYVEILKKMHLDDYMEIEENALNRYLGA